MLAFEWVKEVSPSSPCSKPCLFIFGKNFQKRKISVANIQLVHYIPHALRLRHAVFAVCRRF